MKPLPPELKKKIEIFETTAFAPPSAGTPSAETLTEKCLLHLSLRKIHAIEEQGFTPIKALLLEDTPALLQPAARVASVAKLDGDKIAEALQPDFPQKL